MLEKLADKDTIIKNALDVIGRSKRRQEIFIAVNGRNTGKEIAKKLKISHANCLKELAILRDFGLIKVKHYKERSIMYEKDPFIKVLKIENYFKKRFKITAKKELKSAPRIRKRVISGKTTFQRTENDLITYITQNNRIMKHPFNSTELVLTEKEVNELAILFVDFLKLDIKEFRLRGIYELFLNAFDRYQKLDKREPLAEFNNAFKSLVTLFEPIAKKLIYIRYNDEKWKGSFNQKLISYLIKFHADLKKTDEEYWRKRTIEEASIRKIYPYRHKESHEAWLFPIYETEAVIHSLFNSILFLLKVPKNKNYI